MKNYGLKVKIAIWMAFIFLLGIFLFSFVAPAFRGDIQVQPDYFLGPIRVHMYSWTFFAALVAGFFWVRKNADKFGISRAAAENIVLVNVIAGFFGARIHHVLSAWNFYSQNLVLIPQVWHGGLGIYGGVIGGIFATWIYCRVKKISFLSVADLLAPALVLGQAIGRWGNFFNKEAYGLPTQLPWKMFIDAPFRLSPFLDDQFFHPTFLYESLWAVAVFLILVRIFRKGYLSSSKDLKARAGTVSGSVFASYLILYSLGRFFIEALRADVTLFYGVPANQILALGLMIAGILILARTFWRKKLEYF